MPLFCEMRPDAQSLLATVFSRTALRFAGRQQEGGYYNQHENQFFGGQPQQGSYPMQGNYNQGGRW